MIATKICGITTGAALATAVSYGAAMVGFVFFATSPRMLTPEAAGDLAAIVPSRVKRVGVFVDPSDTDLEHVLRRVPLDLIQLHGQETPERVSEIGKRFGKPLILALAVGDGADLDKAAAYAESAAWFLFDARPPAAANRPGGNARSFDWSLLQERHFPRPWLLSGGLTAANLATAVRQSGARAADVSSGVEDRPGYKDPGRIATFLAAASVL